VKTDPTLVLVTGAGSGIGRSVGLAYARRGVTVLAVDRNLETATQTARECDAAGGKGTALQADVSDPTSMEALAIGILAEHGVPDVVVNNAGIGMAGPFLDTTVGDWSDILGVNVWGVIHGCRLFGRAMVDRGQGGHIVNVASAAAFTPSRGFPAYATTKSAVLMLSECLRGELATHDIGVSAICPGFSNTGIAMATRWVGTDAEEQDAIRRRTDRAYRRRNLSPDTVAAAVLHAVDHNRAVVPVGTEARLGGLFRRISPGMTRWFGALDVPALSGRGRGAATPTSTPAKEPAS
jgi:NAD(P)-dependent dehydrogenase (short-subunit alcohol dehydrogenase family)